MTTAELIAILKEKDPSGETRVFITDWEGGLVKIDITERQITDFDVFDMPSALKETEVGEKVLVL